MPALLLKQYIEQDDLEAFSSFQRVKRQLRNELSYQYTGDTLDVECLIILSQIAAEAGYGKIMAKYWIKGWCVCGLTLFINAVNERSYHKFPFCNWYAWIPRMATHEKAEVVRKMIQRPDDTASTLLMLYNETQNLRVLPR